MHSLFERGRHNDDVANDDDNTDIEKMASSG